MLIIIPAPEFHYQSQLYSKLIFPPPFFFFKVLHSLGVFKLKKTSDIRKLLNVPIKPGEKKSYPSDTVI